MTRDPFRDLGLDRTAGADEIRSARRRLAKQHHPDTGGDAGRMRRINAAAAAALAAIARPAHRTTPPVAGDQRRGDRRPGDDPIDDSIDDSIDDRAGGVTSDVPSFTVEALPAETFEALLVVAGWIGEVHDDDPPYRLDTHLHEPAPCWCRLELVPDAGASTVSLSIASSGDSPLPTVEAVRDVWVDQLNRYDWDNG